MEVFSSSEDFIRAMHSTTFMTVGSKNTINYSPKVVFNCALLKHYDNMNSAHWVRETEFLAVISNFPPQFVLKCGHGCVTLVQIKGIFSPKATPLWSCQPGVFEESFNSLQWKSQN